jgi:hypothetical protein
LPPSHSRRRRPAASAERIAAIVRDLRLSVIGPSAGLVLCRSLPHLESVICRDIG